jgi:uncharacterized protein (TIGR00730 family)
MTKEAGSLNPRDEAIERFLDEYADGPGRDLFKDMIVTVCRLARDSCGRGELKIINSAMKELRYAFKIFGPYHETRKVSIFGSARTSEEHPAYEQTMRFASRIIQHQWMVITGAGNGIMRAGHGGAGREASFGVAIRLPQEQNANDFIHADPKLITFKYFFTRKLMFIKEASAVVLFPGGFGTQDECFESLTLVQTGKADPMPIVMVDVPGGTYWKHWLDWSRKELLAHGMINAEDLDLILITDDVEEAVNELVRFYRVYHSARFVRDEYVFRLNSPLADARLAQINETFADVLTDGTFRQEPGPLHEERGEYPDKHRLVFKFNRRNHGRLRQLINLINADD